MGMHRYRLAALVLGGVLCLPEPAAAQQPQPQAKGTPARPPAKAAAAPAKEAQRAEGQSDPALRGRVEQIEEQLADMQVVIGTLESLGRGGQAGAVAAGPGRPSGGGGVDSARIDSLETQIRALSSQLEQLAAQVRQLSGSRRSDAAPAVAPGMGGLGGVPGAATPPFERSTIAAPSSAGGTVPGFGSTTVTPGERPDPIGRILGGDDAPQPASAAPGATRLPPSATGAANPRELYETAYGYLLQQDYGAAEVAFEEFLSRFSNDRLAADAQYWLGETLYVQRRYKQAGQAFLVVIEKHKASAKVPNSLLKLAQSLEQLGQKDCGIFVELETRHANAPADVRVKARAMKQRQGC
ncbi:MAG: tol-pal system protein YbgF [Hyphomicrobiaceae bacterium]|nr:tol-pal system protein YbgF [Hyphomicrobiaceae bacterium]